MRRFELVTRWRVDAAADEVWRVLTDFAAIPSWWPGFERADVLVATRGAEVVHYRIRGLLGVRLDFVQRTLRRRDGEYLWFRSDGDLTGTGIWNLTTIDGGTELVFTWRVGLGDGVLRWLAELPFVRALLVRSHRDLMRAGRRALQARGRDAGSDRVLAHRRAEAIA